jgi:cytochrome c oxidase cbb3-type subunit 1
MMTIGSMYSLMPRLMGNKVMYSVKAVDAHFWIATIGIVLYIASMWIAGVMQGLMWRAFNDDGTLTYTFIETIAATKPYYIIRLLGGTLFLCGMFIMAWNTFKTMTQGTAPEFKAAEPAIWGEHA